MSNLDFFSTLRRGQDRNGLLAFLCALLGLMSVVSGRLLGFHLLVWLGAGSAVAGLIGMLWITLRIERRAKERLAAEEQRLGMSEEKGGRHQQDARQDVHAGLLLGSGDG